MLCLLAGRRTSVLGLPLPHQQLYRNACQHRLVLHRLCGTPRCTDVRRSPGDERRIRSINRSALRRVCYSYRSALHLQKRL